MTILFVTECDYPEGSAPAVRFHMLMKALQERGHVCQMICMSKTMKSGIYDGVSFISFRDPPATKVKTAFKYLCYSHRLKKHLKENHYDGILCSQPNLLSVFNIIKRYGEKTGCVIVHNMMDWFSSENYSSKFNVDYLIGNLYMEKWTIPPWRVLAISFMLEDYFKNKGCICARIPSLMDFEKIPHRPKRPGDKIIIAYAGRPGTKDYIGCVVRAAMKLKPEQQKKMEFRFIGASRDSIFELAQLSDSEAAIASQFIKCISNLPRKDVLEELQNADFTILFRNADMRYAKAGFPTKAVESLATGTPILCNLSSDLGLYLKDMENAIIAKDYSEEEILRVLERAISLSPEERIRMSERAYTIGRNSLDYHVYAEKIEKLFTK